MKVNELVEGRKYRMIDNEGNKAPGAYGIINGELRFYPPGIEKTILSGLSYNSAIKYEFEEIPFQPEKGEWYYVPHFICDMITGFLARKCLNSGSSREEAHMKNLGCYRTAEEADKAAREKFGWSE